MGDELRALAERLYGAERAGWFVKRLVRIGGAHNKRAHDATDIDAVYDACRTICITYADQFQGRKPSLTYLHNFVQSYLQDAVSGVHILPFCPSSSDQGFSVIDYRKVGKQYGGWGHIRHIAGSTVLMVDLVLNHCSAQSAWAHKFQRGAAPYNDYFIRVDPTLDYSGVFRPRTLPLFHPVETVRGTEQLWTTFSADQLDLNYANPQLFVEMLSILFFYIKQGAKIIRLDAVAYVWKEVGTSCIHHPLTYVAVQIIRAMLNRFAPGVLLITETNVAHQDNISYFGNGTNQAHMVYNFALPPLTLEGFLSGDGTALTAWARTLNPPRHCCFFNFLASHDGIGVLAAQQFLSPKKIEHMLQQVERKQGVIGYKQTATGPVPYELNINFLSAITETNDSASTKAQKFLCAQAIMLSLAGIAAPYIHSIIGSENWLEGLKDERRSINRQRFDYQALVNELADATSLRSLVLTGYRQLLQIRNSYDAFHPLAPQLVLSIDKRLFAVKRTGKSNRFFVCIHNLSGTTVESADIVRAALLGEAPYSHSPHTQYHNHISGRAIDDITNVTIEPYQYLWIAAASE